MADIGNLSIGSMQKMCKSQLIEIVCREVIENRSIRKSLSIEKQKVLLLESRIEQAKSIIESITDSWQNYDGIDD